MAVKRAPVRPVPQLSDDEFVREPFEYTVGRKKITLPSMTWLKPGLIRKIRKLNGTDRLYTLLEEILGEDSPEMKIVDDMDPDAFADMCKAWNDHSQGVGLGES